LKVKSEGQNPERASKVGQAEERKRKGGITGKVDGQSTTGRKNEGQGDKKRRP